MNIIYFNPDQLRADALGCYGHPLAQTPNFDRLAARGVRWDQCYVQHTVCTPSRCSFMTGWYPHVRGHRTLWHLLDQDEPNTLRYLKQNGYETHWIGKNDLLTADAFEESVTRLHRVPGGAPADRDIFPPDDPAYFSFLYGPLKDHSTDWHRIDAAIDMIRQHQDGDPPFMLYLPIVQPHCPFTCPEPWYSMYDPDEVDAADPPRPAELPRKPAHHQLIRDYRRIDQMDPQVLRKLRAVYLGMVSYVDAMLGRLLDALEAAELTDKTAIFAFSDHGEWAGDYGLIEKWQSGLDDCLTRVPMIVSTPDCQAGHIVDTPSECFDIVPTTLELAGIDCSHTHFGRSMLPQLAGEPGDPHRAAFAEGGYDPHEPHCYEGIAGARQDIGDDPQHIYYPKGLQQQEHPESSVRCTMIRTRRHKLIYRPLEVSELYDLEADPRELHNRYGDSDYAEVQQALERRLLQWYVHTSDVTPWERDSRSFPDSYAT